MRVFTPNFYLFNKISGINFICVYLWNMKCALVVLLWVVLTPATSLAFSLDLVHFPKWQRVSVYGYAVGAGAGDWPRIIAQVHQTVNLVPYRKDPDDLWLTPKEFYTYGGDCEDYAIAKYYALAEQGVPLANMLIMVGFDKYRREMHAALLVRPPGGKWLVLDNIRKLPQPLKYLKKYEVSYFINHYGWSRTLLDYEVAAYAWQGRRTSGHSMQARTLP